ncbi:MAG: type 4 fimbrial biogenesis protein PilO [Gammaproteobacteria bacterium]|nr:MAG: type 4 fimbrial biogenesis protein PilO [Gammaproteobacteria bacterium]
MSMTVEEFFEQLRDPETLRRIGVAPKPVRIAVLVLIVLAILGLGYWKVVIPAREEIQRLKTEETKLKKTFDDYSRKAANLNAYREQLAEMERSFGAMLRQLPDKTEVDKLLDELSQTSTANNVRADLIKPRGEVRKEFYAEYPIDMRLFGRFHDLAKFVSDVAALPRIVTLHDISIKRTKEGELEMNLLAKTYYYLDSES